MTRRQRWTIAGVAVIIVAALVASAVYGGDEQADIAASPEPAAGGAVTHETPATPPAPPAREAPSSTAARDDHGAYVDPIELQGALEERARDHVRSYASAFNRRFRVAASNCVDLPGHRFRCRVPLVHDWGVYNLNLHYRVQANRGGAWEVLRQWQSG